MYKYILKRLLMMTPDTAIADYKSAALPIEPHRLRLIPKWMEKDSNLRKRC